MTVDPIIQIFTVGALIFGVCVWALNSVIPAFASREPVVPARKYTDDLPRDEQVDGMHDWEIFTVRETNTRAARCLKCKTISHNLAQTTVFGCVGSDS